MRTPGTVKERRDEEREKSKDSEPATSETDGEATDGEGVATDGDEPEAEDDEEISPQLAEATNVLVDLIAANQSSRSTAKNRTIRNP